jgi:hypothetical protein
MSSIFPVDQLAGSRLKDWKATPATGRKLNRENYTMTQREEIVTALDKHGPMTCERLGAHVDVKHLASLLSGLAKAGVLKKNDVKRGATFALPSQSLPDGDDDAPPPQRQNEACAQGSAGRRRGCGASVRTRAGGERPRRELRHHRRRHARAQESRRPARPHARGVRAPA